jgi:triphosphoribosyl-dephospho-CoA synthase
MNLPDVDDARVGRRISDAYRAACAAELAALKPGNVHRYASGHGMSVDDFVVSAEVSADPLTEPGRGLGERVFRAVEATREAVGCNTNLGILLLCAPVVHAVLDPCMSGGLRARLGSVLRRTDRQDAEWVFRAIRLATPGGLGASEHHDVRRPADGSLLEVMTYAASRDRIARQYATGFADVLDRSVPLLRTLVGRWRDEAWAAAAVFMDFLVRFPDTHIARNHGPQKAAEIQRRAAALAEGLSRSRRPEQLRGRLLALDRELKREGINPGTSADLTVVSLLILRMEPLCSSFDRMAGIPRTPGRRGIAPGADLNL